MCLVARKRLFASIITLIKATKYLAESCRVYRTSIYTLDSTKAPTKSRIIRLKSFYTNKIILNDTIIPVAWQTTSKRQLVANIDLEIITPY